MTDNSPPFVIVVSASPFMGRYHFSAQAFCRAALAVYEVEQVFFHGDGCLVANRALGNDATQAGWLQLHYQHDVALRLCVKSAQMRGIIDEKNATYLNRSPTTIADGFDAIGLAQFFDHDNNVTIMHFKGMT